MLRVMILTIVLLQLVANGTLPRMFMQVAALLGGFSRSLRPLTAGIGRVGV